MKKYYILTFTFLVFHLFITKDSVAQKYGYKGKPLSIYYSFHTMPAFSSPTWSDFTEGNEESSYDITKFNTRHAIWGEYVYNRIRSFGIKYQYFTTAMSYYDETLSLNYPVGLVNHSFGVFYRMYKENKGALGPIGNYHQFDLMIINSGIYRLNLLKEKDKIDSYNLPAVSYTFGNQIIFFDRLITDIGFQLGAPISLTMLTGDLWDSNETKSNASYRILTHMLFNITFTAGLNLL